MMFLYFFQVYFCFELIFLSHGDLMKSLETRYVLESYYKPSIFGSLKYDPIKQDFVEPTQFLNITDNATPSNATQEDGEKEAARMPQGIQWWQRSRNINETN